MTLVLSSNFKAFRMRTQQFISNLEAKFKENLQSFMNRLEFGNGKVYDISITKKKYLIYPNRKKTESVSDYYSISTLRQLLIENIFFTND